MKKIVSLLACIGCFATATAQIDYRPKMESRKGVEIVCPAGKGDANTIVPPPKFYQDAIKNKVRLPARATFEVTYIGFPPAAKKAFQEAVDIWSGLISSPVVIRVEANWEDLDKQFGKGSGVLGAASPADFLRNFDGAQKAFTWYPIAMAEKMARRELNGTQPDLTARFNSAFTNWYFASSGSPGAGQYDFTSVVMHELGHGLGFTGSIRASTSGTIRGFWGLATAAGERVSPEIFDQFVENAAGIPLIDTTAFKNPSVALLDQITNGTLFFNSPIATTKNGGNKPQLYSPTTYSSGSSTYHLNTENYPTGSINSLMTPNTNAREVIKDPGPIVLNMFAEMGWTGTAVLHDRKTDQEDLINPIVFKTTIDNDTTIVAGSAKLVYNINNDKGENRVSVDLKQVGNTKEYTYTLPATPGDKTIRYHFEVKDNSGRTFTSPPQAPRYIHSFKVGEDKEIPELIHFPIDLAYEKDTIIIFAESFDNIGINSIDLEYSVNGAAKITVPMKALEDFEGVYSYQLPVADIIAGNKIRYRIIATDASKAKNTATSPLKNFYEFSVIKINPVQSRYKNDFNTPSNDFAGNFSITQPAGFDNPAIHSEHPYQNGSDPNSESSFVYQLLTPIRLKADSATIRFDEIVLVEPGEPNSRFGTSAFYDYVVVEGSKDGNTWTPFENGYDARAQTIWENAFNGSLATDTENSTATQLVQNSTAKGSKSQFVSREINMLSTSKFKAGDDVLIRFRLFADQLTNGWGWAIDNLQIQIPPPPVITSTEAVLPRETIDLSISPNPSPDELQIKSTISRPGKVIIEVVNMLGAKVITKEYDSPTNIFYERLNIKTLSNGNYILRVLTDRGTNWRRFVVQH